MYAGPASGVTAIFMPDPPLGQVSGATIGEPLIPSPTSGSNPRSTIATFFGQPGRNACPNVPPLALIAYRRPLPNLSTEAASPSSAVIEGPKLAGPSSPTPAGYSSL